MSDLSFSDKQKIMSNVPRALEALIMVLRSINPLINEKIALADLQIWVETIFTIIVSDEVDQDAVLELGQHLELVDSFQPNDLLKLLNALHTALFYDIPDGLKLELYPVSLATFNMLVSGFYIGKARRASADNMSAVSRMGHDLKTPINAITGFSHVILKEIDGPITDYQREDLTSIHTAGKKLLEMINDLTTAMKQDARRFGIYASEYDVSDLVAEVIAIFYPICAKLNHTLTVNLQQDLGTIDVDASMFRWILLGLLMYLSRQGEDWYISLSADRRIMPSQAGMTFRIEGKPNDSILSAEMNGQLVSSTEMINRDVNLATCWRFCEIIGATLEMFEKQSIAFIVHLPIQVKSNAE